jgi:hypothetical protein
MEELVGVSVHKRINEAHEYLAHGDPEAALTPLMNAIEGISRGGRRRFKDWVADRTSIISDCLLDCGPSTRILMLPVHSDNRFISPPDEHGSTSLEEIIYHLMRCGLDHKCEGNRSAVCNARMASFPTDIDGVVRQTPPEDEPLALGKAVNSLQEPPCRVIPLDQHDRRLPVSSLAAILASQRTSILASLGCKGKKGQRTEGNLLSVFS